MARLRYGHTMAYFYVMDGDSRTTPGPAAQSRGFVELRRAGTVWRDARAHNSEASDGADGAYD